MGSCKGLMTWCGVFQSEGWRQREGRWKKECLLFLLLSSDFLTECGLRLKRNLIYS